MVKGAANAIVAIHVGRVRTSEHDVAGLDTIARKSIIAEAIVWCMYAGTHLRVARVIGARNAVVAI